MEKYISKSHDETLKIAADFAATLLPGNIVLLDGDLGAGKTVFSKGIIQKLSNEKLTATSPTFVIMNAYDTTPKVYHFDLYRISDETELDAIGAEEYLYSDGISLIEWPSRVEGFFPQAAIRVNIKKLSETERQIEIERWIYE